MADLALTASPDVRGYAARVALTWSAPAAQPRGLRLVRRRWGTPTGPDDGRVALDLADLFPGGAGATPWSTIDRWRFTLINPRAECGAAQAELAEYYAAVGDTQPAQVVFSLYPIAGGAPQTSVLTAVSRVTRVVSTSPAFASITTVSIFTQPGGGAETLAATLVVSTGNSVAGQVSRVLDYTADSGSDAPALTTSTMPGPNRLDWTLATGGAPTQTRMFARQDLLTTRSASRSVAPLKLVFTTAAVDPVLGRGNLPVAIADARGGTPIIVTTAAPHGLTSGAIVTIAGVAGNTAANGLWTVSVLAPTAFTLTGATGNGAYAGGGFAFPPIVRSVEFHEAPNGITGQVDRSISVLDREPPTAQALPGLPAGVVSYYAAFRDAGAGLAAGDTGSASVLVTGGWGFAEKLFALLPGVHRLYDDPASGLQGSWQLRRYLGIAGAGLDQARSLDDSLPMLRDVFSVGSDFLPRLAQSIGWETDRTLPIDRQRSDILFAPEVYETIGTGANLRALAGRATGWTSQVKEFVDNVLLTNAPEPIRLWQIAEASTTDPTIAFTPPDLAPELYPPSGETIASQAFPHAVDARPAAVLGAGGTIWLFWHSNRLGSEWQPATAYQTGATASILAPAAAGGHVYECTTAGTSGAAVPAFPLTANATVADGTAVWTCRGLGMRRRRIWLQRLGVDPTPVNVMADLPDWVSLPDGVCLFDETPAAVTQAGTIWLAWSSNRSGFAEIWVRAWTAGGSTPGAARMLTGQRADNRFPTLACTGAPGTPLWALWESTQVGETRIWASHSTDAGTTWSAPTPVSPGPRDRTPAALFDTTAALRIFWSADRGASSFIRQGILTGASWSFSDVAPAVPHIHDAAPSAVVWKGAVRLFWHSNRFGAVWAAATAFKAADFIVAPGGNGQVYQCTVAGTSGAVTPTFPAEIGATVSDGSITWTCRGPLASAPLTQGRRIWSAVGPTFVPPLQPFHRAANDGQPAALVDQAGSLRLFLASQQSGARYRSHTYDTSVTPAPGRPQIANSLAKASMGGVNDRLHYTYDFRRTKDGRYARDTVGLFLTPNDGQTDAQHAAAVARLHAFLTPFRPISERLVYFVQPTGSTTFAPIEVDP